jgi:hypothetical protein
MLISNGRGQTDLMFAALIVLAGLSLCLFQRRRPSGAALGADVIEATRARKRLAPVTSSSR